MLRILTDSILSIVYPQECTLCKLPVESVADGKICSGCWDNTKIFTGNETLCDKCGAFLFDGRCVEGMSCGKCEPHHYDRASASGLYRGALAAAIIRLKRTPHIPQRVQQLIRQTFIRSHFAGDFVIIPVPLSTRRRRERGFNQASVIARVVARCSNAPVDETSLIRTIHTPMHRAGMDTKARKLTVDHAFEIVRPKLVEGRRILLVDDVFTTGATVSACAGELKKCGAATVDVLTIAHAA